MHQLYLVAVPKDEADNPSEAMTKAMQELDSNQFAGEGGYFTNHKADWYCVGGRWASFLCGRHEWAETARKEIDEMIEANTKKGDEKMRIVGVNYGSDEKKEQQELLREKAELIWGKHRPSDYPKVKYDRYVDADGEHVMFPDVQDCAELLTEELLTYLRDKIKQWDDSNLEVFVTDECEEYTVEHMVEHPENYIGKYWIVVIDYHT